jgi:hypothetical protein
VYIVFRSFVDLACMNKRNAVNISLFTFLTHFPFLEGEKRDIPDHHALCARVCVFVCVSVSGCPSFQLMNRLTDFHEKRCGPYAIGDHRNALFCKEVSNNDMMEARACEAGTTKCHLH